MAVDEYDTDSELAEIQQFWPDELAKRWFYAFRESNPEGRLHGDSTNEEA
jgi:hypothetical protein